ncbi:MULTISPECIES: autoinducer binding domain-containing protein [unclassified Pseudomonas]|jgi:DNA-binding CsgD family transcriptional regulator|uniref:autoinducer binding domain-containing protein n=1 Tax=unclassified Pseudomonas TaxID=196821 RepID=UPI000BA44214|nr:MULTISPECIES: autoinducer binding domain-containing protein [unclassified Pseudomonas]MCU1731628.1 autoinducer binding domain-containing protein [Pseudomonas sp. 20P_3.2_Bac4]MCU1745751.1 autoinducer binding domain-containing protein [Pseudomonas sp. 20P_3.2_Bac5]
MPHWKQDQLEQLIREHNPEQLFHQALALAQQLDMEYLSLVVQSQASGLTPQTLMLNNFSAEWNDHYRDCNYLIQDPTFTHCRHSLIPLLWEDEVFHETPQLRMDAKAHGLVYGWSQAAHDMRGNNSVLSLVRSQDVVSVAEFYDKTGQALWLCNVLHTLMLEQINPLKPNGFGLSDREREVLKWSAAGKTASDIACILTLSQSTVNFHIRSVITKMNANNKAGAVALAALHGLL